MTTTIVDDRVRALEGYFGLMNMNGAANVYRVALSKGVLDALAESPGDAASIATRCGTAERPTALLLGALGAMGLVTAEGEHHTLSALAVALIGGAYRTLGDQYWAHLPELLQSDEPVTAMDDAEQSEQHYQTQAAALAWMLAPAAEAAAEMLGVGTRRRDLSLLDVGAGSAVWSLAMARRDPGSTITAVDWPAVLPVAVAAATRDGIEDRLTTLPGSFHEVPLPQSAFDLAIIGNVTHLETPEGNLGLLRRLHDAVRPGGELVIFDVVPGQRRGDLNRALYALGLALRTRQGRVYAPHELSEIAAQAGFEIDEVSPIEMPPYAIGMLVARRSDVPA